VAQAEHPRKINLAEARKRGLGIDGDTHLLKRLRVKQPQNERLRPADHDRQT
jgi:hypothetical protein